jgi:5-methyltetrahydrofolate--homocysteine methyltransferase
LANFTAVKPNVIGEQVMEVDLDILVPYIDWTPFLELGNCSENIQQF